MKMIGLSCPLLRVIVACEAEKIPKEVLAMAGEDRFGMELDAVDGILPMADAHDFAFGGVGVDDERVGHGGGIDDERMVARGFEGAGEIGEDAGVVVEDGRGFAVHEASRADDGAAVNVADALVAEADAEER